MESDLKKARINKQRYSQSMVSLCDEYITEKESKKITEQSRDNSREALDLYRNQIFPTYETEINNYLRRFNAGFRLGSVNSVNSRSGSSCNYNVLINDVSVPISGGTDREPSFKNTLSAGDRNTLALAFFFASLENDPNRNQKIVVLDDPITSLDEHRSLRTVQEIRQLFDRVSQVIILSHSKIFLRDIWQEIDSTLRSACKIVRSISGSTFSDWDINQDCITEHDRRHELVRNYIQNSVGADERAVAIALRPILENFVRTAYPQWFPPESLLGNFINICRQHESTVNQILLPQARTELKAILDYANRFHHDTNTAWQTEIINDHELLDFANRTLTFTRK